MDVLINFVTKKKFTLKTVRHKDCCIFKPKNL